MAAPASTIGRYEVLREIGRGAMGVVYEALDPVLDRTVALKVIQPSTEAEAARVFEERFLAEARIAAALQHPGSSWFTTSDGTRAPARSSSRSSCCAAKPSATWRRSPLPWPDAVIARRPGRASARHHAHLGHRPPRHQAGERHRAAVGRAQDHGLRHRANGERPPRLTSTGEFLGTPLYTAPEQARVEDVDGRADIFSLASVAYTLLTGRPPFLAPTIPGIVHRVVYEQPEPPSRLVPDLPPDVERVLTRALAKDPVDRYPTAEALAEDAEDLLVGQPPRHAGGDDLVVVDDVDDASPSPADSSVPPIAARTATVLPPTGLRPDFPRWGA